MFGLISCFFIFSEGPQKPEGDKADQRSGTEPTEPVKGYDVCLRGAKGDYTGGECYRSKNGFDNSSHFALIYGVKQ